MPVDDADSRRATDIHVGQRLRQRRWMLGLTQQQVGDRVGIKFQQIQKYETGQNRVSASRLWDLAVALDVPVGYFFEGLAGGGAVVEPTMDASTRTAQPDPLTDREAIDLVRAYYATPESLRRRIFDLARALEMEFRPSATTNDPSNDPGDSGESRDDEDAHAANGHTPEAAAHGTPGIRFANGARPAAS